MYFLLYIHVLCQVTYRELAPLCRPLRHMLRLPMLPLMPQLATLVCLYMHMFTVYKPNSVLIIISALVVIDFSPSMGPDSLAQWLKQQYGSDYPEDVEKLCSKFWLMVRLKFHLLYITMCNNCRSQDQWKTALE